MARDLHRAEQTADRNKIPRFNWNRHQKVAGATHDVATIANGITLSGAGAVGYGLHEIIKGRYVKGMAFIALGRLADLADGKVADVTGTKSPLGASLDVAVDMTEMISTLYILNKEGFIPKSTLLAIGGQKAVNIAATGLAAARGKELHVSEEGKTSTYIQWSTILAHIGSEVCARKGYDQSAERLKAIGHLGTALCVQTGAPASFGYIMNAINGPDKQQYIEAAIQFDQDFALAN